MESGKTSKKKSRSKKTVNPEEKKEIRKEDNVVTYNDNIGVTIPLGFLKHINNVLLIANQRAHWQPNELIPVGTVLREMDSLVRHYSNIDTSKNSDTGATETTSTS